MKRTLFAYSLIASLLSDGLLREPPQRAPSPLAAVRPGSRAEQRAEGLRAVELDQPFVRAFARHRLLARHIHVTTAPFAASARTNIPATNAADCAIILPSTSRKSGSFSRNARTACQHVACVFPSLGIRTPFPIDSHAPTASSACRRAPTACRGPRASRPCGPSAHPSSSIPPFPTRRTPRSPPSDSDAPCEHRDREQRLPGRVRDSEHAQA